MPHSYRNQLGLLGWLLILCVIRQTNGIYSQTRRILPADSYQILEHPGFRQFGQCNITYAWLKPPPASSLDAYGHALACARLQLIDGKMVRDTTSESSDASSSSSSPEDEMRGMNKELTASMIDIGRLDALMRAEQQIGGRQVMYTGQQLADGDRYFFLADRIGTLNILVLLRPGQQLKLQLIDPISTDHLITPQHVLCSRKQCPVKAAIAPTSNNNDKELDFSETENNTRLLSSALLAAKRHNRELYTQLIISRVACALISFLCVVFAITALTLCVRLRKTPGPYVKRGAMQTDLTICREPHPSPSFYQGNGKLSLNQPSQYILTDASPRHIGLSTPLPGDSASVNNLVMTASNLSECGASTGAPLSYALTQSPYCPLPAYPINGGRGAVYSDSSGMLTFVPMNSRGVLLPYQNGSTSPAPSNHSFNTESKGGIARTGSLGRYSNTSVDNAPRRKLVRLARPTPVARQRDSQIDIDQSSADGLDHQSIEHTVVNGMTNPNDLISFQPIGLHYPTPQVLHRYPGEGHRIPTPTCGSYQSMKIGNHVIESTVGLVRKPALGN